eukprot:CAMPEP_0198256298 /NCGR_PEP_ID=MMETSP1447-20131203/6238_1 /TAXON_ID=420782 /ORGANISM="Chaetoceros dichaeta, Strain CCMP1751" /LENGTH=370 /DNA_ID=CAMNT_0043942899 /DNA_START=125 /DNA_END=1237 /DNA_ORIENTATION=-
MEQEMASIPANSKTGMNLLSKAHRQLDNADADADLDMTWVVNYSIVFQGCHAIRQWNAEVEDEDDVRLENKNLVRFRLCPTDTCNSNNGGGCSSGYGDYIVDMADYLDMFLEMKEEAREQACEAYIESGVCGQCDDDDEDACQNACFQNNGMSECIEDEDEDAINIVEFAACAQYEFPEAAYGYDRKLEDAGDEEVVYYIGPQCSSNGGKVYMSLFTDETCTTVATGEYGSATGAETYAELSFGKSLPYSSKTIIDSECYSCQKIDENEDYDAYAEPEISEFAEAIYAPSGKCEQYVSYDSNPNPNSNACQYLEGIKMVRNDGIIVTGSGSSNKVAAAFIGIFAVSFILLGSYVYYLKSKLDRGRIHLSD